MEDGDLFGKRCSHISCLFPEILTIIFRHLDVKDKGRAAQVCVTWRDAAYNRQVWRGVEAKLHVRQKRVNRSLFPSLVKRGIRRVQVLSLRRGIRDVITGIPTLEVLNLSGCFKITDNDLRDAFTHEMPSMVVLNLSLCKQITDRSLERIAQNLQNLEVLELGGCCNITTSGLMLVAWGLKKLRTLNLRSCRHVSDNGISYLAGLSSQATPGNLQLEHLGLQDCQKLTDVALKHVSIGLTKLRSINLSFCGSITDSGIKYLAKMPHLRDLNLRSCDNVSDTGVGYLAECGSKLVALDVSFCEKVGDQGLQYLSQGLFQLRSLSLCACNINDEGIAKVVTALHEITTLNIGQCSKITDKGLSVIAQKLKNLRSIDLYGCTRITTVGLEKIMQLSCLTTLNLGLWHKKIE